MRPCQHTTYVEGCAACEWCISPTETGAAYRAMWDEPQVSPADPAPIKTDTSKWPMLARLMAKRQRPGDRGLGDTVARELKHVGADRIAALYKRITGTDCKCADRQVWLNYRFPYTMMAAVAILVTGGIGDTLALESLMPIEQRERLEAIYYACPNVTEIRTLWKALDSRSYPRLRDHHVLPTGRSTHYNRAAVEKHVGPLPDSVADWSIQAQFPLKRPYAGSSFLTYRVADVALPPAPYVVVVPTSSWFRPEGRPFDDDDWRRCLEFLEARRLHGVVLFKERWPLPQHPRLLDWQGRTSILQSIEVLKGASGYLGIDSALSVLAAKLFPTDRLAVKATWGHVWDWKHVYYAPRRTFPFLQRCLEPPAWT